MTPETRRTATGGGLNDHWFWGLVMTELSPLRFTLECVFGFSASSFMGRTLQRFGLLEDRETAN